MDPIRWLLYFFESTQQIFCGYILKLYSYKTFYGWNRCLRLHGNGGNNQCYTERKGVFFFFFNSLVLYHLHYKAFFKLSTHCIKSIFFLYVDMHKVSQSNPFVCPCSRCSCISPWRSMRVLYWWVDFRTWPLYGLYVCKMS